MAGIMISPKFHVDDSTGAPLASGKVYTYDAGTSTPKDTYNAASAAPGTENANPIILDSRGEATVYGTGSYKIVVKDSNDNTIYTVDNYRVSGSVGTSDIDNLAVTTAKLAANVLSADATGRGKMQDGFVTSAKLDTGGVALPNGSTAQTQTDGDNSTKVATTAYADTRVATANKVIARNYAEYSTYASVTSVVPDDDTIPTSSEGTEIMSISHAAASGSNIIRLTVTLNGQAPSGAGAAVATLIADGTCVRAQKVGGTGDNSCLSFAHEISAGSTASKAYAVRCGVTAGTFYINGDSSSRKFGGVMKCSLVLEEIKP